MGDCRIAHVKKSGVGMRPKRCGNETKKTWEWGFLPSTSSEHAGKGVRNLIPTYIHLINTS